MGETDKQYEGRLMDEYFRLRKARDLAKKEGAQETTKFLEEEMFQIKLKLQPTELPD